MFLFVGQEIHVYYLRNKLHPIFFFFFLNKLHPGDHCKKLGTESLNTRQDAIEINLQFKWKSKGECYLGLVHPQVTNRFKNKELAKKYSFSLCTLKGTHKQYSGHENENIENSNSVWNSRYILCAPCEHILYAQGFLRTHLVFRYDNWVVNRCVHTKGIYVPRRRDVNTGWEFLNICYQDLDQILLIITTVIWVFFIAVFLF